ncbi:sugar transferase [Rathayibacter oskolensis]|uniref:sugar transferase n=1 Tax=Rathayibacter oskolensis TaxID=1891671 RepID=UPI00265EFFDA|nr:sugar transferase [Rathayibacter oskolensis]WKK70804.1 sugar transferase [Rathayibacter oskolensis]
MGAGLPETAPPLGRHRDRRLRLRDAARLVRPRPQLRRRLQQPRRHRHQLHLGLRRPVGRLAARTAGLRHPRSPHRRHRLRGVPPHRRRLHLALRHRRDHRLPAADPAGPRLHRHRVPLGIVLICAGRLGWRSWLTRQRRQGRYASQVVLLGSRASVLHTARELRRGTEAGYKLVGAVSTSPGGAEALRSEDELSGLALHGFTGIDGVRAVMDATGADTVVVTSSDELAPQRIRELSWTLEPGREHLVVAPSLTDIGGPRIHTRPVAGLPLIHVETPRFDGRQRFAKRLFDIAASTLLIILSAPVLVVVAVLVKATSPGPILFRQERIGLNGATFEMLKFRSMVVDAEARLAALAAQQRDEGNSVLFKMAKDPRVTKVGTVLRRFSLDELPQFLNVFRGDMSLIGPRPPLGREVEQYEEHVHRRFLMKPGITGLWQVSGRSNLSWEDTVRLDLYYVENWSMTGDLIILFKTARAVLARDGAY